MKKISIILPVYNTVSYIDRMMECIVSQTYTNLEIILVDDGSIDGSSKRCDEWKEKDTRISVIHTLNFGASEARNTGLTYATGDAVIFFDSDDYIENNMLEEMASHLFERDVEAVFCGYSNEFPNKICFCCPKEGILTGNEVLKSVFIENGVMTAVWNKLFLKKALINRNSKKYYRFPIGIYIGEDFSWLADVLPNIRKAYCIEQPYYHWVRRHDSATGIGDTKRIDEKALTEIDAMNNVVDSASKVDNDIHYFAFKCLFELLWEKQKIADRENNLLAGAKIDGAFKAAIKAPLARGWKDSLKVWREKIILSMKCGGVPRGLILFVENLSFKRNR